MLLDLEAILNPDHRVPTIRSPNDLSAERREMWEERAAIMEFDGGLPREEAERLAFATVSEQDATSCERN